MRITRNIILCLLLNFTLFGFAQDINHSKQEIEEVLTKLDSVIANKKTYQNLRQQHADSLEQVTNSCHINQYVEKCQELYEALSDYDGRKALQTLQRIQRTEEYQKDKNLQAWVKLSAARTYGIMGLYYKADNLTASINPSELSKDERLHYYLTCRNNYEKISEYMADISIVQDEEKQMVTYYDNIIELLPESSKKDLMTACKDVYLGHPKKAAKALAERFPKTQGEDRNQMCMTMANANKLLNNRPEYIYYLANIAVNNLMNGNTTYEALPYLVVEDVNKYKTENEILREENQEYKAKEDKINSILERLERLEQM